MYKNPLNIIQLRRVVFQESTFRIRFRIFCKYIDNSLNRITINHLAFMVQSVVKFSGVDFKSRHDELIVKKIKLENEIDNVEETQRRIMKNVENYR